MESPIYIPLTFLSPDRRCLRKKKDELCVGCPYTHAHYLAKWNSGETIGPIFPCVNSIHCPVCRMWHGRGCSSHARGRFPHIVSSAAIVTLTGVRDLFFWECGRWCHGMEERWRNVCMETFPVKFVLDVAVRGNSVGESFDFVMKVLLRTFLVNVLFLILFFCV